MTQPRLIVPTLFAALALAAIAAGCSGSSSGSLPASPGTTKNEAAARRKHVGAVLRIHIPPRPKHRKRGAKYVSPNTQSITVGVQLVTASPWPSLPTQTLVVGRPQPCQSVGEGNGLNCTFSVNAYVGKNVFTFNEYATKSPSPQDTPLGTLTTGVTTVGSGGGSLNFTLQGVVNQVVLSVPNPESTQNPATQVTQPVPIGATSSFSLYVNPEDASGASIATDTFSSPITIQVSPANSGVSLALDTHCPGDSATPTKIMMTCASDLNRVTVAYDGTVTQTGANAYVDSAKIVASPQLVSSTPQPANVALESNLLAYQLVPASGENPYVSASNLALQPTSGKIVFAYTTNGLNPTLVQFDPAHPAAAPVTQAIGFAPYFLIYDSAGTLWTDDATSPAVHCFTSLSAPDATIGVSDSIGAVNYPFIAPDASGNIWYSGFDSSGYASIGYFPNTCAAGSSMAQFQIGTPTQYVAGLALAKPTGGNPGVGMVTTGSSYGFYTANTATAASPTPAAMWPGGEYPEGLVNDKAYNIYGASYGTPAINVIAAGTTNIQTLVNMPSISSPDGLDQYSGTQSAAEALAVLDGGITGVALVNPAASTTEPLEIPANDSYECSGVSYDKTGGVWLLCYNSDGSVWMYRPVVTSTWGVVPDAFSYTNGNYSSVITVAEASGTDNSPFTVIGNTNPDVLAVATPGPPPRPVGHRRGKQILLPTPPHEISVSVNGPGSTILTIEDKNGRTQSIDVVVTQVAETDGRRHHKHRRTRQNAVAKAPK